jgi:two-component system, cell cycle sensor histidine kinase and response regulator CckA
VLYVSGYTDGILADRGILEAGVELLEKPFTLEAAIRKVRDILDAE